MRVRDRGRRGPVYGRAGVGRASADERGGRAGERGRSGGRENRVEGLFASHDEVHVRLGHVTEAAVKDDGERDVVQCGVVRGGMAGAQAAGVLAEACVASIVVGVLESSIGLLLFQSKFPAFQISIQHTETRQ